MARLLLIITTTMLLFSSAQVRAQQSGVWYYCDPLKGYYPNVTTCPVPWREVSATAPTVAQVDDETLAQRGLAARKDYEAWVLSITADEKAGADYWAAHRSLREPGNCSDATKPAAWVAGCEAALKRLSPSDIERKSSPAFRAGWNSYKAPAPTAVSLPTPIIPSTPPQSDTRPTVVSQERPAQATFTGKDIAAIVDAARTNELRFQRDYKGRDFAFSGAFTKVSQRLLSTTEYEIEVNGPDGEIYCITADKSVLDKAVDWRKGQIVRIRGRVKDTIIGSLLLDDGCVVTATGD